MGTPVGMETAISESPSYDLDSHVWFALLRCRATGDIGEAFTRTRAVRTEIAAKLFMMDRYMLL
jgi:hypothetical protein